MVKRHWLIIGFLGLASLVNAQIVNPVKWSFSSKTVTEREVDLILTAVVDPGWHLYSQFIDEGGPVPTSFKFTPSKDYVMVGKTSETPKAISSFDKNFNMPIAWHENKVVFTQRVRLNADRAVIKGVLEYMVCDDQRCLPPEEVPFSITATTKKPTVNSTKPLAETPPVSSPSLKPEIPAPGDTKLDSGPVSHRDTDSSAQVKTAEKSDLPAATEGAGASENTLPGIFIAGFIGGLFAFFMPCIYPMIPLTVSFFTKRAGSRKQGVKSAIIYGLSIIVIYVALGLAVTLLFGASALNEAASSATFNLLFFVILLIFATSFLGAFEITLPSSVVNKMDQRSDQGGFAGLFFMAFTLALVSFSCTGPIIGTLLVQTVSRGAYMGPAIGMLGFSTALAIPFTIFAIFPSLLKEMPKSGSWMNTVKVSLGFLELALAFKFLSNVDLAYHWELLNRDIFLVIWIVIFGIWGLYLLGKIRLSDDVDPGFISLTRLFFSMLVLGFTIYLIPGLWGAPLRPISAWLPPQTTQTFDLYSRSLSGATAPSVTADKKYSGIFHAPYGLNAYYDFEEGLQYARSVNKPVLIDFTGWSCTNCRKMEASVWSNPEVLNRLKNDYVLISLYVDDRTELAPDEKYTSKTGKEIKTLGQKWSDLQAQRFQTNSQPYYVIVDTEGRQLVPAQAFNLNIDNYIQFLDSGKNAFSNRLNERN